MVTQKDVICGQFAHLPYPGVYPNSSDITELYAISLKININRLIGDEHNVVE